MSAGWLREAAALMRERAEAATPHGEHVRLTRYGHGGGRLADFADSPTEGRTLIADFYGEGNREHYASWHPAVALAVADWLDDVADRQEWPSSAYRRVRETKHALAIANAYLGGAS